MSLDFVAARCLIFIRAGALSASLAAMRCLAADGDPTSSSPTLQVQLLLQDGRIAIDRSRSQLNLGTAAQGRYAQLYQTQCGLQREVMQKELLDYLDQTYARRGKLLVQLALNRPDPATAEARERKRIETGFEHLARDQPEALAWWTVSNNDWLNTNTALRAWTSRLRRERPDLMPGELDLSDAYGHLLGDPTLADGPLLPAIDRERDRALAARGVVRYLLAPPWLGGDGKLRPTANGAEWDALRPGLSQDVLRPFECRLWYRAPLVDRLLDYFAVRGIQVNEVRDPSSELRLTGLNVAPKTAPAAQAQLQVERPRFPSSEPAPDAPLDFEHGFGGRIRLTPDPLLAALYVSGAHSAAVDRALYLLLPSDDYDRVRREPQRYLCTTRAFWMPAPQPPAFQLPLDVASAASLTVTRQYLTQRMLAERLQRLAAIGLRARLDQVTEVEPPQGTSRSERVRLRKRLALLIVEPDVASAGAGQGRHVSPSDLPTCNTPRDASVGDRHPPTAVAPGASDAAPAAPAASAALPPEPALVTTEHPNHLKVGVDHRPGKPLRWTAGYRRDGVTPDGDIAVEIGHQGKLLGSARYTGDFLGFSVLGRRLQFSAAVFSDYRPERAVRNDLPDERRKGAELTGTLDLWRDRAQSFAQLSVSFRREEASLSGDAVGSLGRWRSRAGTELVWAHSEAGTQASPHSDAALRLARSRSSEGSFNELGVTASHHRFIGAMAQWDARLKADAVTGDVPLVDHLSFGGEDSVRGYREDIAAGRRIWVLQNEVWWPVPTFGRTGRLLTSLRRQLWTAAWIDIGGIEGSLNTFHGRKAAAGVGLRFQYGNALALRLDIGCPVGAVPQGQRRARVLLSVTSQPSL